MMLSDMFEFCMNNLRRRKSRTILTVIGVVVGTCAIIVMVSLGLGANRQTEELLRTWGDLTLIEVTERRDQGDFTILNEAAVQEMRNFPHVLAASPKTYFTGLEGNILAGDKKQYTYDASGIIGMEPDSVEMFGYELVSGEFLSGESYGRKKIPVLVSEAAAFAFRDSRKSWGHPDFMREAFDEDGNMMLGNAFFSIDGTRLILQTTKTDGETTEVLQEYELVIVGILRNLTTDGQPTNNFIMSCQDIKRVQDEYTRLAGRNTAAQNSSPTRGLAYNGSGFDSVFVKADSINNMDELEKQISEAGYATWSMTKLREEMQNRIAQGQLTLGGLAVISLLVAALNIANTMIMSINERTKEIGILKVLGCGVADIRGLFLFESALLGFSGGILGCGAGLVFSAVLNTLPELMSQNDPASGANLLSMFGVSDFATYSEGIQLSVIPGWLLLLSLGFAVTIGLLSGLVPSVKATKISSLSAIRYE